MKWALIPLLGGMLATLPSCGNLAASMNSQSFDPSTNPLDSPGSHRRQSAPVDAGPKYTPGSWVEVTDVNASFYRRFPRGTEQPDASFAVGTPLKVVGEKGSYVKVETEGGQIGYVPAIMVADKSAGTQIPIVPTESLPPGPAPIDPVDPGAVPPPTLAPSIDPADDPGISAPEPEVPPISVEEATPPSGPVVPPDPLGE